MAEQNFDVFSAAPPGHSLTDDNSKWPWGKPPQSVNPDRVFDTLLDGLMKPEPQEEMFKLLMVGVSVETLVEGILFQGFRDGKFTPDVGLLVKGPIAIMIADMAEQNNVPYRMFENDDVLDEGRMDDATFLKMMKQNNPRMFTMLREGVNTAIREGNRVKPSEDNFINMSRKENTDV